MAKTLKHKGPSFNQEVRDLRKRPAAVEDADDWREWRPSWAFSRLDLDGCRWSWGQVDRETLLQILDRLKGHETLKWKELLLEKSNGSIDISHERLAAEAKARFEHLKLHERFDAIWKLRVDGPGRVWGVRIGATLHLVWWDPEHSVYPMNLADN